MKRDGAIIIIAVFAKVLNTSTATTTELIVLSRILFFRSAISVNQEL